MAATVPSSTKTIPTVDLSSFANLSDNKTEERKKASKALYDASNELGFAYIKGHGLPPRLLEKAFNISRKFFDLPEAEKMKAPHPDGPVPHRGYSRPGLEKVYSKDELEKDKAAGKQGASLRKIQDLKESYEVGSEKNHHQPNIWPPDDVLPGFKTFNLEFYAELNKVAQRILEALAFGLNLTKEDREKLLRNHSGTNNQLRLLHYPPVEDERLRQQLVSRMPAHQDWSSFTFVFQDNVGGLELQEPPNGSFIRATPPPGACILNIGDMLQVYSNGIFKSAMHRVNLPFSQSSGQLKPLASARYSIPYFVAPDHEETVFCLPSCVRNSSNLYTPFRWCDYNGNMSQYMYKKSQSRGASSSGERDRQPGATRRASPKGEALTSRGTSRSPSRGEGRGMGSPGRRGNAASPKRTASPEAGSR